MKKNLIFLFALILSFVLMLSYSVFAASSFSAPEGLKDSIKEVVEKGYEVSVTSSNGWSAELNSPKHQFGAKGIDLIRTEELGQFIRGAQGIQSTGILSDDINSRIDIVSNELLKWQWVPSETSWGIKNGEKSPDNQNSIVRSEVQGISGAGAQCMDAAVPLNEWFFSFGSGNNENETFLGATSSASSAMLIASKIKGAGSASSKLSAAKNSARNLVEFVVTPSNEGFGIEQSKLTESGGGEIPTGFMAGEFKVNNLEDSANCSTAGFIRGNKADKSEVLEAGILFKKMFEETNESKYSKAANYILDGILALDECDGYFGNYTRFDTSSANLDIWCYPVEAEKFKKYADNVITLNDKEFTYDTALILYLMQEIDRDIYSSKTAFQESLDWMEQVERTSNFSGGQKKEPAYEIRYPSKAVSSEREPFAEALMGSMFLRASCQINDSEKKENFASTAYSVLQTAVNSAQLELDAKPKNALNKEIGENFIGLKALSEAWEMLEFGCERAPDEDEDSFYLLPGAIKADCDDSNASINPMAVEICDFADNNCDGKIDEGFDKDEDNFSLCQLDCNDNDKEINPGAAELIDEKDNNCNLLIDERRISLNTDNNGTYLENTQLLFFNAGEEACQKAFKETEYSRITANCSADANCTTNPLGICSFEIPVGNYTLIAKQNNNFLAKLISVNENSTDILPFKAEVKEEAKEEAKETVQAAQVQAPQLSFNAFSNDFAFLIITGLAVLLIIVIIAVVAVVIYMINKKKKEKSTGKKVKEKHSKQSGWKYKIRKKRSD